MIRGGPSVINRCNEARQTRSAMNRRRLPYELNATNIFFQELSKFVAQHLCLKLSDSRYTVRPGTTVAGKRPIDGRRPTRSAKRF